MRLSAAGRRSGQAKYQWKGDGGTNKKETKQKQFRKQKEESRKQRWSR